MLVEKMLLPFIGPRVGSQVEASLEDGSGLEELVVERRTETIDEGTGRPDASRVEADNIVAACTKRLVR